MAKKVLVVDDEAHITHVVSMKFRNAGFEVVTAGDGEEALEAARQEPPDLIVTDLQMPYMSGLELCTALKKNPATADIPAIMLTARGYALSKEDLAQTNIRSVMSKPFSPRELLDKSRSLLGLEAVEETSGAEAA